MIKIILIFSFLISSLYSISFNSCPDGQILDYTQDPLVCIDKPTCGNNKYYDTISKSCICESGININGSCAVLLSPKPCEDLFYDFLASNSCDFGINIDNPHNLSTYDNNCYVTGTYNISCLSPLDENALVPDYNYNSPNLDGLSDSEISLINEFSVGNEALLNQSRQTQLIKEYQKENNIISNETNLLLTDIGQKITNNNMKITLDKGFSKLNENAELDSFLNGYALNAQLKYYDKFNEYVDRNSTNTTVVLDDTNIINSINNTNNKLSKISDLMLNNDTSLNNLANSIDINSTLDISSDLNSFSDSLESSISGVYDNYSNVLGFGGSYGSAPTPYFMTLKGTTYKIFDLSYIDSVTLDLIRNVFIFIAHLIGLTILLRGD